MADNARKLIAATFETPDGGSRAAGALGGSMLGKTLAPNSFGVVIEIAGEAVEQARKLLEPLNAQEVVVQDVDSSVASLFANEAEPVPEPELVASAPS